MNKKIIRALRCIKDRRIPSVVLPLLHRFAFSSVLSTPALQSNPAAGVQVWTLLRGRDCLMYLASIKSLLRYYNDVAVCVCSDGSLSAQHVRLLQRHIVGISVHETPPEAVSAMSDFVRAIRLKNKMWRKVTDIPLLAQGRKFIMFDSDIMVTRRPDEMIAWMKDPNAAPFYLTEHPVESFMGDREKIKSHNGLQAPLHFNAGLLGVGYNDISREEIEEALKLVYQFPRNSFEEGLLEQSAFAILFARRKAEPLDPCYYITYWGLESTEDKKLLHCTGYIRGKSLFLASLVRNISKELKQGRV